MNYFAFLSIGVFAALLFVIAAHYDPNSEGSHEYTPSSVVAAIKSDQQQRVLIAREKHGIHVDESVIAQWEGKKLNQFASVPTPAPKATYAAAPEQETAFTADAWYQVMKDLVVSIFSTEK